jgi:hypothetical protein
MELLITIAVAGAVGGLVKSLVEQKGKVALPGIEIAQDGTKYVHLGGAANLVLGAAMALLTTVTPAAAVFAGISSAFLAEKALERVKNLQLPIPVVSGKE